MRVIARKKGGIVWMYVFTTLLSVAMIVAMPYIIAKLLVAVLLAVSLWIVVEYCLLPTDVITLDLQGILHFPKGKSICVHEITDVSYRRASAKGVQYKWGTVIIQTAAQTYKYRYIADCEEVSKVLTELMYTAKIK